MTARELIVQADKIRQDQNLSQAELSRRAGFDECGVAICRTYNRGNCKLSTMIQMLKPLGYALKIEKVTDLEDLP